MTSEVPPTWSAGNPETSSLGDLLGDVTRDMSTLIRQEMDLAKAELRQSATRAGKGSGLLAGAGVAGHFVLLFLSLALWWGLGTLMGFGWAGVVVAVAVAVPGASSALFWPSWAVRNSVPSRACPGQRKPFRRSRPRSNPTLRSSEQT